MALFSALRSSNDKDQDEEKREAKRLAAPVISAPVKETASTSTSKDSTPRVSPFLKGNGSEVSPSVAASAAKLDALASKKPTVTWIEPEPAQTARAQTGNYLSPTQRQASIAQQTQDFYRGLTTSTTPTTSPYATNRLSALDLRRMADPEFSQSDSARLVSGSASAGALGSAAGFVGAAATLAKVADILHRGVTNQDVLDRRNALNDQMAAARTALRNGDATTARAYAESAAQLREELTDLEEHLEDKALRTDETKLSRFVNAAERMYDTLAAKRDAETAYAQRGQNIIGQYAGKLITTGTQMAGDALMNIIPGGGLAAMGVRASGDASQQAALNGASVGEQLVYGAAVGAVEVLTEKMFDGLAGIYGKGDADEAVKLIINHMSTTEGGRKLLNLFASGLGELSEEVVSGIIDPALETIYNGKQVGEMYTKETAAEILEDAIVGGLLGLLGGGVTAARTNYTETLDAVTKEYMALDGANKMNYKTAQQKAAIVEKALDGGKLSAIDINALDLTNAAKRDVFNRATGLQLDESVNQLLSQPDGRQQLAKQIQDGITTEQAQAAREGATEAVAARVAEIQNQQAEEQNIDTAAQDIVNSATSRFDKANTLTYNEFKNRFAAQNNGTNPLADADLRKYYDQYLAEEGGKAGDPTVLFDGQQVTFRQLQSAFDQLADRVGQEHIAEPVLEQEFEQRLRAQGRPSEIPSDISIPLPDGTTLNYEQFKEAALQNAGAETATEEELAKEFLDIAKERGVINQKLYDNLLGGIINGRDGVHNGRLAGLSDQRAGEQTGRVAGTAGEAEGESARGENVPLELGVAEQTGEISRRVKASRQASRVNEAGAQTHKVKRGNGLADLNVVNEADEAKIFDATPGLRDLVREARAEGYEVLLVTEPIETGKVGKNGKPETADGMHTGRRIVVQVNSVTRPAQNLFGHEYHHAKYENDLTYRAAVDSFVGEIRDDGELNLSIRDHYNTEDGPYFLQFGNFSDNYADYYEELVADIAGDFNRCLLPQADFNQMRKAYKSAVREAEAKQQKRVDAMQEKAVQAVGGTNTVTTENLQVAADDIFPPKGATDEKYSVGLYREAAEKQEVRLLSNDTKSTPAETASGRDVLYQALKQSGKSARQINKVMKFMDAAAEFMGKAQLQYHYIGLEDINNAKLVISPRDGRIVLSAMVKNGEYPVNFDLTKVCARRVAMDQFVSELAHRPGKNGKDTMLEEVPLTQENIFRMNEILRDAGYDTACLGCFVESRRYNIQEWASSFVDEYNAIVDKVRPDSDYFGFTKRDVFTDDLTKEQISALNDELERYKADLTTARKEKGSNLNIPEKIEVLIRSSEAMQKKLKVADLITQDGRTNLHKLSPELESLVLGHYGSNTPKSVEVFTPYNNEIALLSENVPNYASLKEYLAHIAGVRSQSFSDFIITHMFDVLQKTADLYARDLPAHTYTKVPSRARLFGMTGEKINMSIMFNIDPGVDWAHAGLRENGEYFVGDKATMEAEKAAGREQVFDQSFPWDEAVKIMNDPRYSKDCGTIGVGYSYHHIMKMLGDDMIRYVIGYHSSGMPSEIKVATHIQNAADYTPVQNTLEFKGFKFVKNTNDYGVPSYASWGQGQKETTTSDTAYDLAGECKRVGPRAAMQNFLHFAEERSLVPDTSTAELTVPSKKEGGKPKQQEQKGHGDFNLYEDLAKTKSPRATAENYMRWCLEQNMLPVFYEFSTHPNYYKLLFDFNVIDPLTGKYAPQTSVRFEFPENFLELADQYMAEADLKAKEQSEKFEPTLEQIYDELSVGEEASEEDGQEHFSISSEDAQKLMESFGLKKVNDYVYVQNRVYETLKDEGILDDTGKRVVTNKDSGRTIVIDKRGIFETFGPQKRYQWLPRELKNLKLATVRMLPEMIETGKVIDPDHKNEHKKESNLTYSYIKTEVQVGNDTYPVFITIRQSPQKNRFWLHGVYTDESQLLGASSDDSEVYALKEQPASKTDDTTNPEDVKTQKESYSLAPVEAVEPKTDEWERGATFDEVKAAHPTLFELAADEAETRNPTQIRGTVSSYRKIYDALKKEGFTGDILDASSGLGYGTKAGRDEYGFNVDDIEPFPDASYKPKYTDYSKLDKQYDVIISNAVLNVIPQDLRDAMVVKIGEMLKPGGRAFINVRGDDVKNASSKTPIDENRMEYFIENTGSYQKGFTPAELRAYLQDALGDGFTVRPAKNFGKVSAVVTKNGAEGQTRYSVSPPVDSKAFQNWFKDSKVVNEDGTPKVMYHGTSGSGFTWFDTYGKSKFGLFGLGGYFTDNPEVASEYTRKGEGQTPGVYPVYLSIQNPIDMDAPADYDRWAKAMEDMDLDSSYLFSSPATNEDEWHSMLEAISDQELPRWEGQETAQDILRAMGYDGITHIGGKHAGKNSGTRHRVFIVFDPEQVKSVYNQGSWDPNQTDIRYSISPELRAWLDQQKQDDGLGAADAGSVNSLYDRLQAQSKNFHPSGPAPVRHTDVPTTDFAGRNIPKSASTIYGAQGTTDSAALQLEQMIANGQLSFDTETDQKAVNKAKHTMNGKGFDGAMEQYRDACQNGIASKENTALGQQLLLRAMKEGNDAATAELLTLYTRNSTTVAQALQAQSMFRKLSPEGQLVGLRKAVSDLNEKYGTDIQLTEEEIRDFTNARSQEEREAVHDRIVDRVADLLPKNFKAKFDTIRYLAMLGNPRTHIRNILGNALFQVPVFAKNRVGAIGEALASAVSGGKIERTKSLTGIKSAELLAEARADFEKVKDHLGNISKYNEGKSVKSEIEQQAPAFANKGLGKAINWVSEKNGALLEAEDMEFKRFIYVQSLAGYLQANGYPSIAEAEKSIEGRKLLARARNYAAQEAMRNTFNDRNMFSDAVASLGKLSRSDNKAVRAAGYVVEGVAPFKRTPTNILVRAGEYSPIGAANGIVELINGAKSGDSAKVTQGIDRLAAGLSGSALMYLGWLLAGAGKVRGGDDDDDKQKNFDSLRGHQNYSFETEDGKSMTLDWLAPEAIPFFMGVELYNAALEGGLTYDDVMKMFKNTTAPMLEMSMLQSLNDMFENAAYAKNNNGSVLGSVLTSALTSYVTQVFPTILGQAERTAETERMTTYTDKNSGVPTDLQYTLGKISQKIPKWDYNQIPYIDAWGRTKETGTAAERALNNFANPAYLSDVSDDAMEDELQRLYDTTGENVLPQRADRKIKVNGEDVNLTAQEYVEYAKLRGTMSYELVNNFVSDPAYSSLTDEEKAHAIRDLYSYANDKAKAELFGAENKNTAKFDEAVSLGISPEDYALSQATIASLEPEDDHKSVTNMQKYRAIDSTGMSQSEKAAAIGLVMGNEMLTEAGNPSQYAKMLDLLNTGMTVSHYLDVKQMHDVIGDGEGTAAQKATKFVKALNDTPWLTDQQRAMASDYFTYSFGATAEANQKALAAEQYGISIDDFYRIKGAVDADGNGSMSKAELTAYLNANYPAAQRRALFELFGGGKWNNPY